MSLITIVETKDIISIISDGQGTDSEGNSVMTGFQKFYTADDYFVAVGNSEVVARLLFSDFREKNADKTYVEKLLKEQASLINKEYGLIFCDLTTDEPQYTLFNHFNQIFETRNFTSKEINNLPIFIHSGHLDEVSIGLTKYKISQMVLADQSNDEIIEVQKNFHQFAANTDQTVNDELFHHIFHKKK
ncbi:hypothetical protein COE61_22765 [Bacillus thuringiensis]|uniref:hypothetical protein n=1 Tax=Bacillus thuringiensis TaxID=1428 RepID=UPI000BEBCB4B|nr:hypothetical protein [Bacillus thuringiensis]PDX91825.1 hypothetical protein COM78_26825 [Bacillus thuringiensis]PGZ73523.1 hypothetical protein COE61_22765 [Bacillus thuringiensis]